MFVLLKAAERRLLLFAKINTPSESVGPSVHRKIAPDNLFSFLFKIRSSHPLISVCGRAVSVMHTERLRKVEMNSG